MKKKIFLSLLAAGILVTAYAMSKEIYPRLDLVPTVSSVSEGESQEEGLNSQPFYVSVAGQDSNVGSISQPWKTIQKAAETIGPGDTVYIKEGTYHERVILKNSGTSTSSITFSNYPGDEVIIDGRGIDWGFNWDCLFNTDQQDYLIINGLTVMNSNWGGIGDQSDVDGSHHVVIKNCTTFNTRASGIAFYNCENISLENNKIEKANMAYLEGIGCQEAISLSNVKDFVIKKNEVLNITNDIEGLGGEGIDVKDGCRQGKIIGNIVHHVAKMGIYLDSYSKEERDIEVFNNYIYQCGAGITVAAEKGGLLADIYIHNNTIKDCKIGFTLSNWGHNGTSRPMDTIIFHGNTLSGITEKGVFLNNKEAKNIIITENILGGKAKSVPIYVKDMNLDEITIRGNVVNALIPGHPSGFDYILMNSK